MEKLLSIVGKFFITPMMAVLNIMHYWVIVSNDVL